MTRKRTAFLLILLVASCDARVPVFDQSRDGGSDAFDGADVESLDGGSDGGSDGGTALEIEAYEGARRSCQHLLRCSPATFAYLFYGGLEHCIRTRGAASLDVLSRGRRVADPEACDAALYTDCIGESALPDACQPIPGPLAEGETCDEDWECALDDLGRRMHCEGGCDGRCARPIDLGAVCATTEQCDVASGHECVLVSGLGLRCATTTTVADGESCAGDGRCVEASTCDASGICVPRPVEGEVCDTSMGLRCFGSYDLSCLPDGAGVDRCQRLPVPRPAGGTCTDLDACAGGGRCVDGMCPATCLETDLCVVPTEYCDSDTARCEYVDGCS